MFFLLLKPESWYNPQATAKMMINSAMRTRMNIVKG